MIVISIFMNIILCLLATASAVPARSEEGRNSTRSLVKKADLVCEIVNFVTTVNCWYWPSHASTWNGNSNYIVTAFAGSTYHNFNCYLNGQTIRGIA
jgi:hypothetical protein